MKYFRLIPLLSIFSFLQPSFAQDSMFIAEIAALEALSTTAFREKVPQFYYTLSTNPDFRTQKNVSDRLFTLTMQRDERAHVYSLLFRAAHFNQEPEQLFDLAYALASKYHAQDLINAVEHSRAKYFLAHKQYDKAMQYLLRYHNMVGKEKNGEGYREIINLMGDIYYQAGIYDKAGQIYSDLLDEYKTENHFNFFRPYVLMNNMGQIALKSDDTKTANEWFIRSLTMADTHLKTNYRNNSIAYIKVKLAETAMECDSLAIAEKLLGEVATYPSAEVYNDVKQEWAFQKARLLVKHQKLNEAFVLAKELLPANNPDDGGHRFIPAIYQLMADICHQMGNDETAYWYQQTYTRMADSLNIQNHLAASMIILANHNEQLSAQKLQQSKQQIRVLLAGLLVVLSVLISLLILYRKLYQSKLELIRKTLTKDDNKTGIARETPESGAISPEEAKQQTELIGQLKTLMEKEKIFLNPGLCINDVSKTLSTNRTYLSRAINNQLGTNFSNYINEYRVKEAVGLIQSGFSDNHTQEALAKTCGFTGRNVFIIAFKKYTGVVPSFFIANYKKWDTVKERFEDE
ncbi:MAG: helix-turn-helix transcriptional regulator [Bacteroidales bacterium]|nr:helix-turn-helix transcriptional regulator [Bacteroidales bacterium]